MSVNLSGLTQNTIYHFRVKAVNSKGTTYGSDMVFTTSESEDNVTDFEGNVYKTIQIGSQEWMGENLKVTKFNDGNLVPLVKNANSWLSMTTPAYCWYNNDKDNKEVYGALYNWYSVNTGKLCPIGWHVPSLLEWTALVDYLGGYQIAGGRLKEAGTFHWDSPNTDASNSSGFTAFPGGYREPHGPGPGPPDVDNHYTGFWLSSTEYNSESVYSIDVSYHSSESSTPTFWKNDGYSVRCIKDN
jgi:uncharacterized protein (TIGR02145 family)